METSRRPARPELLAGILAVLLLVLAFAVLGGETPDLEESAAEVAKFYKDDADNQMLSAIVTLLAAPFWVIFGSALRSALRLVERPGGTWASVAFAGSVILAIGCLFTGAIHLALSEAADKGLSPEALQTLNALDFNSWPPLAAGMGILMLGTGVAIVRNAGLPKWLGWVALIIGIVCFTPIGFAGVTAGALWTIVLAVMLSRPRALDRASGGSGTPPAGTTTT